MGKEKTSNLKECNICGEEKTKTSNACVKCGSKRPIYKKNWFIVLSIIFFITIFPLREEIVQSEVLSSTTTTTEVTIKENSNTGNNINESKIKKELIEEEYTLALEQANSYSDTLSMSKQGIYNQLISEHGGNFTKEAAKYAIDNIQVNWNNNALESAKSYQKTLEMSLDEIYDQLISQYGGQFTKKEAQYAVDNL